MENEDNKIKEVNGSKVVVIDRIRFKGKRTIEWSEVEAYLKNYIGQVCIIEDTKDKVFIGKDFPDEYTHSKYTHILKGANARAKANAAQGIMEMLIIANKKEYTENQKIKHSKDAKYGWYSYTTRFAVPVYDESGRIERYNVFCAIMLVRHGKDDKLYLYDVVKIKKEMSILFESKDCTQ